MRELPIYDVAIVGFGPVGAMLANLLARRGLAVAVVERTAAVYDKPRAISIDHEALRILQAVGPHLGFVLLDPLLDHEDPAEPARAASATPAPPPVAKGAPPQTYRA